MGVGVCRETGKTLGGWAHFVGMATDVLTTSLGSRQKRRGVGCRVPELLAKNTGDHLLMQAQAYAAQAMLDPENGLVDEFELTRVVASRFGAGIRLWLSGKWQGEVVSFPVDV